HGLIPWRMSEAFDLVTMTTLQAHSSPVADAFTDSGTSPPGSHDPAVRVESAVAPLLISVREAAARASLQIKSRIPIIPGQGQPTTGQLGGSQLARRRYQKGHLFLRGKREKEWIGR